MDDDNFLINRYLEGDDYSLKILIDKHTDAVYNFCSRFVGKDNAYDLTQDVFVKIWKNISKFDNTKSKFKTWMFTITRNTITDFLRKKKAINFSFLDEEIFREEDIIDESMLADEIMDNEQNREIIKKELENLPDLYKEVLVLYYQEDLTFKEISQIMNKSINTLKSQHLRGLKLLKDRIRTKL